MVKSDEIVELDNNKLPTGRLLNVGGSKFDFRKETKLSDKHGSVALLDNNFCFSSSVTELCEVAELELLDAKWFYLQQSRFTSLYWLVS